MISVIIPTYKDWNRLRLCLNGLSQQTISQDEFEIIVVNNEPKQTVPKNFSIPDNCQIILEELPGSYSARNKGIQHSSGDIIAFTDSDCIPDKDWLKNSKKYFDNSSIERIGGNVEIFYANPEKRKISELYESLFAFNQKRNVEKYAASITANLIVRREIFDKVGLFDSSKMSGEDFGWNMRATKRSFNICYKGDVIVFHPARESIKDLVKKKRRVFGGKKNFNLKSFRGICKELIYLPYIFYKQFIPQLIKVIATKKRYSGLEKLKMIYVIFILYAGVVIEYFNLLLGGSVKR